MFGNQNSTMYNAIFLGTLLLLSLNYESVNGIKTVQRRLSPTYTLTLVYGDKDAMKSHMDALQYCRRLGKPQAEAQVGFTQAPATNAPATDKTTTVTGATGTTKAATTTASAATGTTVSASSTKATEEPKNSDDEAKFGHIVTDTDGKQYRSDLVSVHDGHMVNELMKFVLAAEKRQFWIGAVVKMIEHMVRMDEPVRHLLQLWTDRSPANFRFLHYDNPKLISMQQNELACVSVDYASGKWGLHDCETPMYFVCETVEVTNATTAAPSTSAATAGTTIGTATTGSKTAATVTTTAKPAATEKTATTTPKPAATTVAAK